MNFTREYDDDLDGNFLACKPGHTAEGLESVCNVGMPLVGAASLGNGLWMCYLAYKIRRQRLLLARHKRDTAYLPKTEGSPNKPPTRKISGRFSFMEKRLLASGVPACGDGFLFLVSGFGTMYPTTHIRGQIGDFALAIYSSMLWYNALLQHRTAIAFKSSIPQPRGSVWHIKTPTKRLQLPSLSTIMDMTQSWLAPVIALLFWGLLRAGVYSRGWFIFVGMGMLCLWGMRTFSSIVFQRLATLKQITIMVNAKGGTREEISRRRNFLTRKLVTLVIDLTAVFMASVLWPGSMILLGSTFNSRQFAIHAVVMYAPLELIIFVINLRVHSGFNHMRKIDAINPKSKTGMTSKGKRSATVIPNGGSLLQDSSVAMQSDV